MIYVNLRNVNLSATVTNKRSHVAKVYGLIYERGEISNLGFISKDSDRCKKE